MPDHDDTLNPFAGNDPPDHDTSISEGGEPPDQPLQADHPDASGTEPDSADQPGDVSADPIDITADQAAPADISATLPSPWDLLNDEDDDQPDEPADTSTASVPSPGSDLCALLNDEPDQDDQVGGRDWIWMSPDDIEENNWDLLPAQLRSIDHLAGNNDFIVNPPPIVCWNRGGGQKPLVVDGIKTLRNQRRVGPGMKVRVILMQFPNESAAISFWLTRNIFRHQLTMAHKAYIGLQVVKQLQASYQSMSDAPHGYRTHKEAAKRCGVSPGTMSALKAILNSGKQDIIDDVLSADERLKVHPGWEKLARLIRKEQRDHEQRDQEQRDQEQRDQDHEPDDVEDPLDDPDARAKVKDIVKAPAAASHAQVDQQFRAIRAEVQRLLPGAPAEALMAEEIMDTTVYESLKATYGGQWDEDVLLEVARRQLAVFGEAASAEAVEAFPGLEHADIETVMAARIDVQVLKRLGQQLASKAGANAIKFSKEGYWQVFDRAS